MTNYKEADLLRKVNRILKYCYYNSNSDERSKDYKEIRQDLLDIEDELEKEIKE